MNPRVGRGAGTGLLSNRITCYHQTNQLTM